MNSIFITGSNRLDRPREGDHICYISDLRKIRTHFPDWDISKSLDDIFTEIVQAWRERQG